MNPDYPRSLCVHGGLVDGGWFGAAAYAVDLVVAIALLYLFIRNVMALCPRGADAARQVQVRFRLLLCKRLTQVLGLFGAFQFCQFLAYALFMLAYPSKSATLVLMLTYAYQPILFTFGVLAFGMVQYAVLDAVLSRRAVG